MKRLFVVGALCGMMISNYSNGMDGAQGTLINHMKVLPKELWQKILAACSSKKGAAQVCKRWAQVLNFETSWAPFLKSWEIFRTMHLTENCCFKLYTKVYRDNKFQGARPIILSNIVNGQTVQEILGNPEGEYRKKVAVFAGLSEEHAIMVRCYRWLIDKPTQETIELLDQMLTRDPHGKRFMELMLHHLRRPVADFSPLVTDLFKKHGIADSGSGQFGSEFAITFDKLKDILVRADLSELMQFLHNEANKKIVTEHKYNLQLMLMNELFVTTRDVAQALITWADQEPSLQNFNDAEQQWEKMSDWLLQAHYRQYTNRLDILELLLQRGAQEQGDHKGWLLEKAVQNQDIKLLRLLLKYNFEWPQGKQVDYEHSDDEDEGIYYSVSPLRYLVYEQSNPLSLEFLQEFVKAFSCNTFEKLVCNYHNVHTLMQFAEVGLTLKISSKAVDILLKARYCREFKDGSKSPLLQAIQTGDLNQVKQIVEEDPAALFEVNASGVCCVTSDAVVYALALGKQEIAEYLNHARIKHFSQKQYTIYINTGNGDIFAPPPLLLPLEVAGPVTVYHVSPLMYAVCTGKAWLVRRLQELGHQLYEVDLQSPWLGGVAYLAKRLGNQEIIDLLEAVRPYNPVVGASIGGYDPEKVKKRKKE